MEFLKIGGSLPVGIVIWTLIVVGSFLFLTKWTVVRSFLLEISAELKRVTWPWDPREKGMKKYKGLIQSTVLVIVISVFFGLYIFGLDVAITYVLRNVFFNLL